MGAQVKIMVVDDTITYRQILSKVVEGVAEAELVGSANSGKTCLMKLPSLKPDLVFLDVMMPEMDGIETLKEIKKYNKDIQVVMVSAFDMENAKATLQSLEHGALDFVAKPQARSAEEGIQQLTAALLPIIRLLHQRLYPGGLTQAAPSQVRPAQVLTKPTGKIQLNQKLDLLLIGISTGGPNALHQLFESLKKPLPLPVLIVQHMPPMFTQSLAERLDSISSMKVKEAAEGDLLEPGAAYIAPGGKHMVLRQAGGKLNLGITDGPPVNHCKPAVDVLFRSVAAIKGIYPLSVIMTGMGRDGTEGVKSLKRNGVACLIQDEASSVVWGMPGSIYEAELADEILPLTKIGDRLTELCR